MRPACPSETPSRQCRYNTSPPPFLLRHLPPRAATSTCPCITLTWAQSLDAKIAGPGGARVILSGPQSMEMTHWMRTMHDAILVGINTILMDDPRLKVQLLPQDDPTLLPPQPLILDPQLRFPLTARLLSEWNTYKSDPGQVVRQPWLICGNGISASRRKKVENAGARVIPVPLDSHGRISPNALPQILQDLGLKSVMIEGGSRVLSTFLRSPPRQDGRPLVDSVIVTVAPMFIGEGIGVVPEEDGKDLPGLQTVHTERMGKDAVMVCTVEPRR